MIAFLANRSILLNNRVTINLSSLIAVIDQIYRYCHVFAVGAIDLDNWGIGLSAFGAFVQAISCLLYHLLGSMFTYAFYVEAVVFHAFHLDYRYGVGFVENVADRTGR